jgi:hypothetical protein
MRIPNAGAVCLAMNRGDRRHLGWLHRQHQRGCPDAAFRRQTKKYDILIN